MMNDVNPFGRKPVRQVNPRFALNGGADGADIDDFGPSGKPVPERVKRPVPRPIGAQDTSPAPSFPPVNRVPVVNPNSMFSVVGEDDLSLDVGVNETDSDPVVSVPASAQEPPGVEVADDELNLDLGVNETESEPAVVPPVSVIPPVPSVPVEEDLVLDKGVNETDVEPEPAPQVSAPVVAPAPQPVVSVPKKRAVNPLFADPVLEDDDEDLDLNKGVNETDVVVPKRQVSPLFDFKSDKVPVRKEDPDRLPVYRKPGSLIDVDDEDALLAKKGRKSKKGSKKVDKPARRGFQLQERDITLLRFLTKYQFSYVDALARVLNSTPKSISNRLRVLEEHDLVKRQVIAAGSTLWQTRKAGIELCGMNFTENKKMISFATIRHTIGLVNLAAELEREAPDAKDILGLADKFGEPFPVRNRFPGGIRLYGEEALNTELTWGEMTVAEREIRQGQKRYRGGRSSAEMRDMVDLAILNPEAPELEEGNEGLFVVYGTGGKTGEHVPDLVVTRPRNPDGTPNHFAIELELTPKSPSDWKRILRSYREAGGMYSRIYYFTSERPIANMIRNADEEVGLGDKLVIRKYTPKNKRQPFLG